MTGVDGGCVDSGCDEEGVVFESLEWIEGSCVIRALIG